MTTIDLIDLKGDVITLTYAGIYRTSKAGLCETWCYAHKEWLPEYQQIPMPVFTEWWT